MRLLPELLLLQPQGHRLAQAEDLPAVVQDGQDVRFTCLPLDAQEAGEELVEGDLPVAVVEEVEELVHLVDLQLQGLEVVPGALVLQHDLELLVRDEAVLGGVALFEELLELRNRLGLLRCLLHHLHLGVLGRHRQSVPEEQRRDDPDHREDDAGHVECEEEGVPDGDLGHQGRHPRRPAAAEGDLEHGPERLGRVAVSLLDPQPVGHVVRFVHEEALERLATEDRRHQHEDEEDDHGPDERHDARHNGLDQDAQAGAELHGPHEAQRLHQLHVPDHPRNDDAAGLEAADLRQDEGVQGGDENHEGIKDVEEVLEEGHPVVPEPDHQFAQEQAGEDVLESLEGEVGPLPAAWILQLQNHAGLVALPLQLHEEDESVDEDQDGRHDVQGRAHEPGNRQNLRIRLVQVHHELALAHGGGEAISLRVSNAFKLHAHALLLLLVHLPFHVAHRPLHRMSGLVLLLVRRARLRRLEVPRWRRTDVG
mmetsp:Transcript_24833/g.73899  ORF Transcript_24833/g.73899 Transcript_24833/m.73899 type:complete len:481 (+) Transcript_24833:224-1666(+)